MAARSASQGGPTREDKRIVADGFRGQDGGIPHSVLQGKVLLVRDEGELTDFIERVAREYMDFAYLGYQYLLEVLRS